MITLGAEKYFEELITANCAYDRRGYVVESYKYDKKYMGSPETRPFYFFHYVFTGSRDCSVFGDKRD